MPRGKGHKRVGGTERQKLADAANKWRRGESSSVSVAVSSGCNSRSDKPEPTLATAMPTGTQMAQSKESSHLLVAAFDIGTTFSGYALSFRDDPLKVQTNQGWNAGSEKLISLKTPTCVLLNDKKKFHSFGFEAENKYTSLAEDNKHNGWMLFSKFKMMLHNNNALSRTTIVDDINGNSMPAMTIFSMSIQYLREHFLEMLHKQTCGVEETDIQYVITVPAIWNDNAKQFMREAAEQAGMDATRLKLALEPEVASIWCQTVKTEAKGALSGPGTKYMVIDLGGGTADISVHEKKTDGTLKELHCASGGPWGGIYVDKNYMKWLATLYGERALDRLKNEDMADYFDILRDFETKKRTISSSTEELINLRISASLKEFSEEQTSNSLQERVRTLKIDKSVSIKRDKMRVDPTIIRNWFDEPVDACIEKMNDILLEKSTKGVNTILLVGGFGESTYVHERLKSAFPNKRIIVPEEAGLVVLKGAVRFGHNTNLISSRIMKYTYGVDIFNTFKANIHLPSKKVLFKGKEIVKDVFDIFVKSGETIETGHTVTKEFIPIDMHASILPIFCSDKPETKHTTDASCKLLGKLIVKHGDGDTLEDKVVDCSFIFWETEISVKVKIKKTGEEFFTTIDCLS